MNAGSARMAIFCALGTTSMSSSCRLPSSSARILTPVTLPPGRANVRITPAPTILGDKKPTTGMVWVNSLRQAPQRHLRRK